ncbi:hypothetical protein Ancab_037859 [Ancistrocladus abbreviatus]
MRIRRQGSSVVVWRSITGSHIVTHWTHAPIFPLSPTKFKTPAIYRGTARTGMANKLQPTERTRTTTEGRRRRRRQLHCGADAGEEEGEDSLQKLEEGVKGMTEKLTHYRSTFPDQLKSTVASVVAAQRPELPIFDDGSEPGPSGNLDPGSCDDSCIGALAAGKNQGTAEKVQ